MTQSLKILILEDKASDAELAKLQLEDLEYQCRYKVTDKKEEFTQLLEAYQPDLIISDFNLPRFDGLKALAILRKHDDLTPFIFLTGTMGEENAVEAIRSGATDFIIKQRIEQLPSAVIRALREKEQKQSKKIIANQLLESERNYKNLFHLSPLPMWVYELHTFRFLNVNEAAINHYGYSREEFYQLNIKDIRPEKDLPLVDETVRKTLQTNAPFQGIFRHKKKNGEIIDVEIKSTFIEHEGNKARLVVANDITQRKQAETELKKSNHQLKLAQQIAKLGYWTHHLPTDHGEWSEEVYTIWERDPLTFDTSLENFLSTIHPADRHLLLPPENEYADRYREIEHRICTPDGKTKWIFQRIILIEDENGNPVRYEGVAQDITEKKKLEIERQAILESITDGFFAVDNDWKVTYWNKAAEEILHITKDQIMGKNLWDFADSEDKEQVYASFVSALNKQEAHRFEAHYARLNSWLEISIFPKGEGLSVYVKDISERKHHQQQIFKTIQETQENERARFGRDMHDGLTQSLTAIKMNLTHFKDRLEHGETRINLLERAIGYVNNSIKESRTISHGLLSVTLESYGLITALEEIAENLNANNKLHVTFNHNFSPQRTLSKELEVNIYRIVQEAMNNTIKHSKATEAQIILSSTAEGIQLIISDNGIGIKGLNDKNHLPGAGLKNIKIRVEGFDGKLTFDEKEGHGLQMNILFPKPISSD